MIQPRPTLARHFQPAVLWLELRAPEDYDEEEAFLQRMDLLPACATIIQDYGGEVRYRPDGLSSVFGVPVAGEADTEQAALAAEHILRHFEQLRADSPVTIHIGISQGNVVAGEPHHGNNGQFTVIGEPVVEAVAMAELIPAGQIWLTDKARRSAARLFDFSVSPQKLNGNYLWHLRGRKENPRSARGLPGLQTPMIGRDRPLQVLRKQFQSLASGHGNIVWIEGEAGIGKSRLMREFTNSLPDEELLVWPASCTIQRSNSPFSLFTDLFGRLVGRHHTDSDDNLRTKINLAVNNWPRSAHQIRPHIEILLGLQPHDQEGERLLSLEPEQLRRQIFVAVRRFLQVIAKNVPIILILDDLHWIDPISAELLLFAATIVASDPVMLLCAQRKEGSDAPNDRLVKLQSLLSEQTVPLLLNRLSSQESQSLIEALLSSVELPQTLLGKVITQSEGNPYFIEEFVQMMLERGYLERGASGWLVDLHSPDAQNELPTSIESLIRSRFDILPEELRQMLHLAAVIGRGFKSDFMATILDRSDAHVLVERLGARLILRFDETTEVWQFNHILFQSVVYNSLISAERERLHLVIAEALLRHWGGNAEKYADELSYHFSEAKADDKALPYYILAAERAANQDAKEEALLHFKRASAILAKQQDPDPEFQWRIAVGLGDVYRFVGNYIESTAVLKSGLPLAQEGRLFQLNQAGLYRRLGETSHKKGNFAEAVTHFRHGQSLLCGELSPDQQLEAARTLIGLAWVYFAQGKFEDARQSCEEAFNYANAANGLNELASLENLLGGIYFQQTEWRLALKHTTRAMVLREQMGYSWGVAATLANLGILNFAAGQWDKALSFLERSLMLRQEMGDVEGIAITHNNTGIIYREQGKFELASSEFEKSLEVCTTFSMSYHKTNAQSGLAQVHLKRRKIVQAEKLIDDGLAQARELGARETMSELHCTKAELLLLQEEPEQALQWANDAIVLAVELGNRSHESTAWRHTAEAYCQLHDYEQALANIEHARDLLAQTTDELETGRLALQAAKVLNRVGNSSAAYNELNIARQIFARLGANHYLSQTDALLATAQ